MKKYWFLLGLSLIANSLFGQETLTIKEIGLELVKCPAGSFMMGSPEEELGRYNNETQHKVTITKPFYIGKYEVTQKEYEAVMGENPSSCKDKNNPVECVRWEEAIEFCEKLNKKFSASIPSGFKFDLPTEAHWEYACRAGTSAALNNGKNLTTEDYHLCPNLDEVAWYIANPYDFPNNVGKKKPNAWGIYDMHGNVWEWCKDLYEEYPKDEAIDPIGATSGSSHVIRGGSWCLEAKNCRSACRYNALNRSYDTGFRVALVWDGKTPISENSSSSSIKKEETPKTESAEKTSSSATNNSDTSSSNNSNPNAAQKSSASYDTKEYKPIELKPIKTHPKVIVPEELELEP